MSNSEARKRAQEQVASAGSGGIAALAEIIHRALEPVGAEGAPKCPEDGEGFVGCYAAAGRLLRSDWLAADRADQRRLGAEAVVAAVEGLHRPRTVRIPYSDNHKVPSQQECAHCHRSWPCGTVDAAQQVSER